MIQGNVCQPNLLFLVRLLFTMSAWQLTSIINPAHFSFYNHLRQFSQSLKNYGQLRLGRLKIHRWLISNQSIMRPGDILRNMIKKLMGCFFAFTSCGIVSCSWKGWLESFELEVTVSLLGLLILLSLHSHSNSNWFLLSILVLTKAFFPFLSARCSEYLSRYKSWGIKKSWSLLCSRCRGTIVHCKRKKT